MPYQIPDHRRSGIQEIMGALEGVKSVVLTTHLNADGDGAGCEAAVAAWLRSRGIEAWIVNPTPFPATFKFVVEDLDWIVDVKSDRAREVCQAADLALVLDTGEIPRIGRVKPLIDHLPKAVIDHHPRGDQAIGGASFRDTTAAAAGELIFDLIHASQGPWGRGVLEGIYVAILTDTGSFAFSNTVANTYRVMAELVELGASPEHMHRACYGSVARSRLELLGHCLATLEVDAPGTTAWMTVPPEAFVQTGATIEDLEGLTDYPRSINGVEVAILFRTTDDGSTKISLRSNGATDVNAVARSFGGGGHVRAAGALIRRSVPEVQDEVVAAVQAAVAAGNGAVLVGGGERVLSTAELPRPPQGSGKDDPGVPEALPRVVRLVGRRLGTTEIDRMWLFEPLRQGRRESGLVAVSFYEPDEGMRRLVTASYVAERTGKGLVLDPTMREEGSAPPETMPRVIAGVVKRADLSLGDPREVAIERDPEAFEALMGEFDPSLLVEEPVA